VRCGRALSDVAIRKGVKETQGDKPQSGGAAVQPPFGMWQCVVSRNFELEHGAGAVELTGAAGCWLLAAAAGAPASYANAAPGFGPVLGVRWHAECAGAGGPGAGAGEPADIAGRTARPTRPLQQLKSAIPDGPRAPDLESARGPGPRFC
jgi:hypothetical protein